jgi:hypothetical protein
MSDAGAQALLEVAARIMVLVGSAAAKGRSAPEGSPRAAKQPGRTKG